MDNLPSFSIPTTCDYFTIRKDWGEKFKNSTTIISFLCYSIENICFKLHTNISCKFISLHGSFWYPWKLFHLILRNLWHINRLFVFFGERTERRQIEWVYCRIVHCIRNVYLATWHCFAYSSTIDHFLKVARASILDGPIFFTADRIWLSWMLHIAPLFSRVAIFSFKPFAATFTHQGSLNSSPIEACGPPRNWYEERR